MCISIVIVDDHELVRKGLISVISAENDFKIVGEAANGFEAVKVTEKTQPDILLLDLRLPDISGIEVTEIVREKVPSCRVVILSTYQTQEEIMEAIKAGISGYILKGISPKELTDVLRNISKGESYLHPSVTSQVMNKLIIDNGEQIEKISPLTKREKEILNLIAIGLRNKEIAHKLWISEKTVKTHVSNILSKLNKTDRTAAVIFAMQEGLISLEDQQNLPFPK